MKEIPAVHSLLLEAFLSLFCFAKLFERKRIKILPRRLQPLCSPPQNSGSALPLFGEDPTHQTGSLQRGEQVYSPSTFLTWGEDRACPLTLIPPRWLAPVRRNKFAWPTAGLPPLLPLALHPCWAPQLHFSNICPKRSSLMHTLLSHIQALLLRGTAHIVQACIHFSSCCQSPTDPLSRAPGHRTWVLTANVGQVPFCSAYGGQSISSSDGKYHGKRLKTT